MAPPNNSLALASAVLGGIATGVAFVLGFLVPGITPLAIIVVLMVSGLPGLLAIIFGFVGISTANRLGGVRKGMAINGVILGFLPLFVFLLATSIRGSVVGV